MIFNINSNTTKKEYKPCYLLGKLKNNITLSTTEQTLDFEKWKQRGSGFFIEGGTFEVVNKITFNLNLKLYLYDNFTAGTNLLIHLYDVSYGSKLLGKNYYYISTKNPYTHLNVEFPYIESTGDNVYKLTAKVKSGGGTIKNIDARDTTLLISELFDDNR